MPIKDLPCAVARWFADGEGWAYDPKLSTPAQLVGIAEVLEDVIKDPLVDGEVMQFERRAFAGWLV